ncbi:ribose-phosphate pyrophosphokinase [Halalkaliarchaeum desulfuricum]|uniref:Ribose-phosphate pyrophosphokinase n=1 Tax=Halalkaliarchaeum desulfuricum TaxID=2055893 RepID=A0A343TNU2_9EURY|nr:ribose-phosphate diphosphokinase [Halalkaliarchaeum desulfuricum]AUX10764.1 ribose-phosphate pyrophosphokinase [Halalkaliarchaeum desulfuricum]
MIVPGSRSQALSAALAAETGLPLATPTYDRFPDGETLASVPAFEADHAVVVAATPSNDAYVELLQLQDAVREAGAESVTTVLPYMGYTRQDRAFKHGQPVSARAMARAVSTGTDRVGVVNPHESGITEFFDVPCESIDAADRLAEPLPDEFDEPLFLAPDEGAVELIDSVRDGYGRGETDYFEKTRDRDTGDVEITPSDAQIADRDVVVADDIIATGSTMSDAVDVLLERGAARVFVACVHPLLVGNAFIKLSGSGIDGVYGTDTLERSISSVTVAPAIAEAVELGE